MFKPRWMSNAELAEEGLVVGSRMFKMHFPDVQAKVMSEVRGLRKRPCMRGGLIQFGISSGFGGRSAGSGSVYSSSFKPFVSIAASSDDLYPFPGSERGRENILRGCRAHEGLLCPYRVDHGGYALP